MLRREQRPHGAGDDERPSRDERDGRHRPERLRLTLLVLRRRTDGLVYRVAVALEREQLEDASGHDARGADAEHDPRDDDGRSLGALSLLGSLALLLESLEVFYLLLE